MKIRVYYKGEDNGESFKIYQEIPILVGNEINDEYKSMISGKCPTCGTVVTHGYVTGERVPHCNVDDTKPKCPQYYVYEKNAPVGSRNIYPLFDELITVSLKTKSNLVLTGEDIQGMRLRFEYARIEVLYDESNALSVLEGYKKFSR